MPFYSVAVEKSIDFSISIDQDKKVVLVNMSMLALFATELNRFFSEQASVIFWKMVNNILLIQNSLIIVVKYFLL